MSEIKKTGATPIVEEGLSRGEVLGVIPLYVEMVKFRDGHGKEETKIMVSIPNGESYFLTRDALDLRPAQAWLKKAVANKRDA